MYGTGNVTVAPRAISARVDKARPPVEQSLCFVGVNLDRALHLIAGVHFGYKLKTVFLYVRRIGGAHLAQAIEKTSQIRWVLIRHVLSRTFARNVI